jgi:hypothetical protein
MAANENVSDIDENKKAFLCLLCSNGNHVLLIGNPDCVCCPTHYQNTSV